jgi:hypothetical protein
MSHAEELARLNLLASRLQGSETSAEKALYGMRLELGRTKTTLRETLTFLTGLKAKIAPEASCYFCETSEDSLPCSECMERARMLGRIEADLNTMIEAVKARVE